MHRQDHQILDLGAGQASPPVEWGAADKGRRRRRFQKPQGRLYGQLSPSPPHSLRSPEGG